MRNDVDLEPFRYAALLHARYVISNRPPTRDEISMLLYAFAAWARQTSP